MAASKARRYLISLQRCGLVDQDKATSHYVRSDGCACRAIALMPRHIRFGTEAVIDRNQTLDRTTWLTVWSDRGPIIIAWYDASETLICNLYVGSILPLLRSISGRLFLSYLPRQTTKALLRRELDSEFVQNHLNIKSERDVGKLIADIRGRSLSYAVQLLVPGLGAVGAPIFDLKAGSWPRCIVGLPGTGAYRRWERWWAVIKRRRKYPIDMDTEVPVSEDRSSSGSKQGRRSDCWQSSSFVIRTI